MGLRRDGREAAIQFLYQFDAYKPANVDEALTAFWKQNEEPQNVRDFSNDLIRGALEKLPEVDAKIRTLAAISCGWRCTKCFSGRRFRRWFPSTRPSRSPRNSAPRNRVSS